MSSNSPRILRGALLAAALLAVPLQAEPFEDTLVSSAPLEEAWFGHAVAMDGDTLVVGAPMDDTQGSRAGMVTVFVRTATGWKQQERVFAIDVEANDSFGWSVAIDGDRMAVGAPGEDERASSAGAVYVFQRTGSSWTQVDKLTAADGARDDNLGSAVAISGDTVAGGARSDDDAGNAAGSVYVFRDEIGGFAFEQHLLPSGDTEFANLGEALALEGDVLVAGAPSAATEGGGFVFERSGTTWSLAKRLFPAAVAAGEKVGSSVAVRGDTILMGVREHAGGGTAVGAVFVYRKGAQGWALEDQLVAPDAADVDVFGWSAALGEDFAVVGALGDDHSGVDDAGSAYVFTRDGTTWSFDRRLGAATPGQLDYFGHAVGTNGTAIAVGAPFDDDDADDAGTVTIYDDIEPPTVVEGFVLPRKVDLTLAPGKRGKQPGLTLVGKLDTGATSVDLMNPTTLEVGTRTIELGPPVWIKRGRALLHETEDLKLTLTPDRRGSSGAALSLRLDGDLNGVVAGDGDLTVRLAVGTLDARTTVRLVAGSYRPGKSGALVAPDVLPSSVKCKLRGGGRDQVKIVATYSGAAPAGDVHVVIGDTVDLLVPGGELIEKKRGKLEFKGTAPGVSRLILDPRRGRITLVLANVDLGTAPVGDTAPLDVGIELVDESLPARITVARKGATLRY